MNTPITPGPRAVRARKLSALRTALNAMLAYIDRMAPVWTDGQLVQAMTHVGRQRRIVYSVLHDHESAATALKSPSPPSFPHFREVGRSMINVMDLYGLPRESAIPHEVPQLAGYHACL